MLYKSGEFSGALSSSPQHKMRALPFFIGNIVQAALFESVELALAYVQEELDYFSSSRRLHGIDVRELAMFRRWLLTETIEYSEHVIGGLNSVLEYAVTGNKEPLVKARNAFMLDLTITNTFRSEPDDEDKSIIASSLDQVLNLMAHYDGSTKLQENSEKGTAAQGNGQ